MESNLDYEKEGLVVAAPVMLQIYQKARFLSQSTISVLIYGESGTGKSRLAEYIKKDGPFIRVDCNAIPSDLFASELFGYMPNAFTGAADKGKIGLLEAANHGTILFDEINELSLENQVLLLHFLQNQTITPIGALESKRIDARIIATSGRNLRKMIEEGTFRQDLYYRICVADIYLPPLRERKEEIPEFIRFFIHRFCQDYGISRGEISLSPNQMAQLIALDWVGNIREIENFAQQLCFWGDTQDGIDLCIRQAAHSIKQADIHVPQSHSIQRKTLKSAVREFERDYIQTVIDNTPNLHAAAEMLDISFSTLCRKKADLGLQKHSRRTPSSFDLF